MKIVVVHNSEGFVRIPILGFDWLFTSCRAQFEDPSNNVDLRWGILSFGFMLFRRTYAIAFLL